MQIQRQWQIVCVAVLAVVQAVLLTGCETSGSVAQFLARGSVRTPTATGSSFSWTGATAIDVVTSSVSGSGANSDTSTFCTTLFGALTAGCQQQPALIESDGRWFVGFTENYLPTAGGANVKYSAFVNMTNTITNAFSTVLGSGLGIIDSGDGINPAFASSSSRYIRFAKFTNGDVIAVFYVHDQTNGTRAVYGNVYNAVSNTWGAARRLSDSTKHTDAAGDFTDPTTSAVYWTHLCRPTVATSGDGSALVAWCEGDSAAGGSANSEIKFTFYRNGAWTQAVGTSTALIDDGVDEYALPGIHGTYNQFPPNSQPAYTMQVSDIASTYLNINATTRYVASATAVAANAGAGQFNLVTDTGGTVQVCETLQNMLGALLAVDLKIPVTLTSVGSTLSQLGVSAVLNPSCVQSDSTTWRYSFYYNRSLSNLMREVSGGAPGTTNFLEPVWHTRVAVVSSMGIGGCLTAATCGIPPSAQWLPLWQRSAMVDAAGDGFGNYALVRSLVSSTVKNLDISTSGVLERGRMLVGHEYVAGTGWRQRTNATAGNQEPATSFISNVPMCFDGTDTFACSVRNPKVLMSNAGHGLIFFHQKQWALPSVSATTNPNRLWYATYGVSGGFSSVANVLDEDIFCSNSSTSNDESVCETGQYGAYTAANEYCMGGGEPLTGSTISSATSHDVPPIASAMNSDGEAVIAYHKRGLSASDSTVCSDYTRLHVATYDSFNGLSSIETIDDDNAHTMHANVAITANGNIAVVWESYNTSTATTYVYLKTKINGSWTTTKIINDTSTMQASAASMMPSVGINDDGEIVVSYSYGASHAARRQYVNYYYYH